MEQYMTTEQVAERLCYAPKTIRKWCMFKKIPYTRLGRKYLIKEKDIMNFIRKEGKKR